MVHPEDLAFALSSPIPPGRISALFRTKLGLSVRSLSSPSTQGAFNKVYFVSLEEKHDGGR